MMHNSLCVALFSAAIKSSSSLKVVGLVAIKCLAALGILLVVATIGYGLVDLGTKIKARFPQWLRASQRLVQRLKAYLATVLGGYDPVLVNHLLYRSALLVRQASSGKFSPAMKPVVDGQIQYVQEAICKLDPTYADQFRSKPSVRRVEIVNGTGEGMVLAKLSPEDGKLCHDHLLTAAPGS